VLYPKCPYTFWAPNRRVRIAISYFACPTYTFDKNVILPFRSSRGGGVLRSNPVNQYEYEFSEENIRTLLTVMKNNGRRSLRYYREPTGFREIPIIICNEINLGPIFSYRSRVVNGAENPFIRFDYITRSTPTTLVYFAVSRQTVWQATRSNRRKRISTQTASSTRTILNAGANNNYTWWYRVTCLYLFIYTVPFKYSYSRYTTCVHGIYRPVLEFLVPFPRRDGVLVLFSFPVHENSKTVDLIYSTSSTTDRFICNYLFTRFSFYRYVQNTRRTINK